MNAVFNKEIEMNNKDRLESIKSALARAIETATESSALGTAEVVNGWSKEQKESTTSFPFARSTW